VEKYGRVGKATNDSMVHAHSTLDKATKTHSEYVIFIACYVYMYKGADKSLARPGKKQATATEDFDFHISYL
jgi:hypothetical protein